MVEVEFHLQDLLVENDNFQPSKSKSFDEISDETHEDLTLPDFYENDVGFVDLQSESVQELSCFSCGSLLFPEKTCETFDPSDPSQVQVCPEGDACLLYSWKKSKNETGKFKQIGNL